MSAVIAVPDVMVCAATDLVAMASTLQAAHLTAAPPTSAVLPAAADEVSTRVAHLFSGYAQDYQRLAGQAAAFQDQFVHHLKASASTYAGAEAANAASLRPSAGVASPVAAADISSLNHFANSVIDVIGGVLAGSLLVAAAVIIQLAARVFGPEWTFVGILLVLAVLGLTIAAPADLLLSLLSMIRL